MNFQFQRPLICHRRFNGDPVPNIPNLHLALWIVAVATMTSICIAAHKLQSKTYPRSPIPNYPVCLRSWNGGNGPAIAAGRSGFYRVGCNGFHSTR